MEQERSASAQGGTTGSPLAEAGAQYWSLFTANPHAAFWLDCQGRFLAANPAAVSLTGWSADELTEMGFDEVIHPDDLPRVMAAFLDVLAGHRRSVEARMRHRDGHVFDLSLTAVPITEGEEVVGVHGIAEDVTERNQTRRRLAESQAALLAANAEADTAKATFLANMNHEVRTPLTSLIGYLELLTETELSDCQSTFVDTIARSGQRLLDLVDDLLDLSALESGAVGLRREPMAVRRVLGAAAERVADLARQRGLAFSVSLGGDVPATVLGDATRLIQVLGDLLDNAVKFTDEGAVALEVSRGDAGPGAGQVLRFAVRDTGIGIPEAQRARLFEPFTQGDTSDTRRHGGAGVGLAVVRRAVDLMGGTITVESSERGSVVTVEVPFEQ
jgi:PAS domain S-box-containing protein